MPSSGLCKCIHQSIHTYSLACAHACKCTPAKNVETFSRKCGLNLHNPFPKFTVLSIKLLFLETSIKSLNVCSTNSTLGKELGESILLAQLIHAKQWTRGAEPRHLSSDLCGSTVCLYWSTNSPGKTTSLCGLLAGKHSSASEDPATTELWTYKAEHMSQGEQWL